MDLRVELVDAKNHWYTIAKAVDRQLREDVPAKRISMFTHNVYDYSDPHNFRRQTLVKMISQTRRIVESKGGKLIGATVGQIAEEFRRICPVEQAQSHELKLDTRGR